MMTVRQLYAFLEARIPRTLSCSWDNDGLAVCASPDKPVRRVLVTLDVTADAIAYAEQGGFDVVLSHHPLLFSPLRSLCAGSDPADRVLSLLRADISAMSFHTRLDAVDGGVNDCLAAAIGLCDVDKLCEDGIAIGRIGHLPEPMPLSVFALQVKNALGCPTVSYAGDGIVSRVALVSGSGAEEAALAFNAGADTYLSGELKYHQLCDAPETGHCYVCAGHFHTEFPVCRILADWIRDADPSIETELFASDRIGTV